MSDIIPRKKAVAVKARRADLPAETIQIPGVPPIPMPPAKAEVTQNIIYVNVPAAQPVAAPQSPPTEVHFHTTNIYQAPRRSRREMGTSFLGLWALVFGGVAGVSAYMPPVMGFAKPIAAIGAVCAGAGLIGAVLFRRVGRGVPLFALLVCGASYCMWLNNNGQLGGKYDALRSRSPVPLPKVDFDGKPDSPAVNSPAESAVQTTAHQPPPDHSIFGNGQGTGFKPTQTPAPPAPIARAPVAAAPAIDAATAEANLEQARVAAALRMRLDYAGAKTAAAEAQAQYRDAQIGNAPGSPELIAASQRHLQADSKLKLVEIQLRSDPAVAAAEAVLKTAK